MLAAGILSEVNRPVSVRSGAVTVRISVCAGIAECAAGLTCLNDTSTGAASLERAGGTPALPAWNVVRHDWNAPRRETVSR